MRELCSFVIQRRHSREKHEELVTVYHYGLVRWIPPAIYKSSCQVLSLPFWAVTLVDINKTKPVKDHWSNIISETADVYSEVKNIQFVETGCCAENG